jgi:O-antigen ligase
MFRSWRAYDRSLSGFWRVYRRPLLQLAIVLGVLSVSTGAALAAPKSNAVVILAVLPFLIVGGLLFLRWPPLGLLLLITGNVIISIELPSIGLSAGILMGLVGLWVVDMVIVKREISLVASPTIPPLIVFSAVTVLAFLVGFLPWFPSPQAPIENQVGGVAIFLLSFAAFILVAHQVRDIRWLKWMVYLFMALAAPSIIIGMRIIPASQTLNRLLYSAKTTGGSLFWIWLVAMSFSQAVFNRKLHWRWRIVFALITVGNLYLSLGRNRGWTSGWAPVLTAMFVILWVGKPRIAMPLTMVGTAIVIVMFQPIYNAVFVAGGNDYSAETRLAAWVILGEIIKENPILGLGPANYYNYTALFPILGWYVEFNSHNNYVDIVAQTGILGLLCFFWFIIVVARLGWQLRTKVPKGGFSQAYVYACLGGLAGTLVAGLLGDWVLPFVYNIGIFGMRASSMGWLFLGGLVAIDQLLKMKAPVE